MKQRYQSIWAGAALFMLFLVQMYAFQPIKRKAEDKRIHFTSDRLYHDASISRDGDILIGNVRITHDGMILTCDSAVVYENSHSFLAYGSVNMTQGDSISLKGDSLYYDGTQEFAQVFDNVEMRHGTLTLYTDILNYDRRDDRGFYDTGGKIVDRKMQLTSDNGEYFTNTKMAVFHYNVLLTNDAKDSLVTDTLYYDANIKLAHAIGPSNIMSGKSTIYTEDGYYSTTDGKAQMYQRPILFNEGKKLTGDSIFYDKEMQQSFAYGHIVFTDEKNKMMLLGQYGWYDDKTGRALCTDSALAKDYSQGDDTLFVHADTLRMESFHLKTDSVYRNLMGYFHVRAYRNDMQMVCDSLSYTTRDSCMRLYKDPIIWSENRQILGEVISVYISDSTIDSIYVDQQALMIEQLADTTLFDQVSGNLMRAWFREGELNQCWVDGNGCVVNYPMEKDSTFLYSNYIEAAKLRAYIEKRKLQRLVGFPSPQCSTYPLGQAPPEKTRLKGFAWFSDIRPRDKNDLFEWRAKKDADKLKAIPRRRPPMQTLKRLTEKIQQESTQEDSTSKEILQEETTSPSL